MSSLVGEISADGRTIEGRWERGKGDAGDQWEIDTSRSPISEKGRRETQRYRHAF